MTTVNAYASFTNTGIRDKSTIPNPILEENVSQFTPLFAVITAMGRPGVRVINSSDFVTNYGEESLDPNGDYYNHQTEALKVCIENNNSTVAINRVIPKTAETASYSLGVDITFPDDWFSGAIHYNKRDDTYIPILDITADNPGEWGNKYGFSIKPATYREMIPLGLTVETKVYKFRLYRIEDYTTLIPLTNLQGNYDTFFTFKPDTIGRGGINYYIEEALNNAYYQPDETLVRTPVLGKTVFHFDNFVDLLQRHPNYDESLPVWNQDLTNFYGTDLVMFQPFDGEHYHVLSGGQDGFEDNMYEYVRRKLSNLKIYDQGVFDFLNSLTEDNAFSDIAKYPYSCVIDTGFSVRTKLAMRTVLNTRRDVWCLASCFTVADYFTAEDGSEFFQYVGPQDEASILAMGSRLESAFSLYPESYKYGTSAVRTIIIKNAGVLNNAEHNRRRTLGIALLKQLVPFMGGGNGEWNAEYALDSDRNKVIAGWSDVDGISITSDSRLSASENGLSYVEWMDTKHLFFPYLRTIYPDPTSVLCDFLTMVACCYLEKVGAEGWRRHSGTQVSSAKRRELVTNFILDKVRNRFNGRYEFRARVDDNAVLSNVTDIVIEIYADKVKISNLFTIEAHRAGALEGQNQTT